MGPTKRTAFALMGLSLFVLANAMDAGKEYRYTYSGKMNYMVTANPHQQPGMAFRSKIRMQKLDDMNYGAKIEDLEIATTNERSFDWKRDVDTKLTFTKNHQLSEVVERPFVIQLKPRPSGLGVEFGHMETFASDPIWSVNLKKGLASFLNIFVPQNEEHIYESRETTTHGDCLVYWNIQHRPHWTLPDAKVLNVTRVVDHEKCTTLSNKIYGSLKASPCVNCESVNTHPLSSTSRAMYSLVSKNGDRKGMYIEDAKQMSTITHAPYTENGNIAVLNSRQKVHLTEIVDVTEKLEITGDKEVHQHLNMIMSKDKRLKRPVDMKKANDYVADWGLKADVNGVITAMKEMAKLDNHAAEEVGMFEKRDPSKLMSEIIEAMYMLDYEQTAEVFQAIVSPGDKDDHMQNLFVSMVAAAGHNAGVQFIMDKIKSGEIDTRFVDPFLRAIHLGMTDLTQTALDAVLDFCKSDILKNHRKEHMQCMLVYTAMVDETCRVATFAPELADPDCFGQKFQNEVFDKLVPEYKVAAEQGCDDMNTYIHMAANLKTHKAVEFLQQAIVDKEMPNFGRLDAMRSLLLILPAHMPIVRKIAAEVYLDPNEPSDLRMMASTVMLKSNPPLSLLKAMTDSLLYEKSDQVRSYVVSMIKELDHNGNHPCFKELSQHLRYIAPKVAALMPREWKRKDYLTSHVQMSAGYSKKYDMGGHSVYSMIMSDSYLPREIYYGFGDYFANFFFENFGISVRQQGLDRITDHFNNPRTFGSALGKNLWNMLGRRRLARDAASVKQEVDQIDSTLKIQPKKYEPMMLEIALSGFGQDLKVLKFNETNFLPLLSPEYKPGTLLNNWLSTDRDMHKFMNLRDFSFVMPTEVGVPAWLDIKMPTVISYKRKESSFDLGKDGVMKLKIDRRLVVDARLEETFGIGLSGVDLHMGVGMTKRIGVNAPLHLDVDANIVTGKISLNKDFQLPRDVLHYDFTPYTYIAHMQTAEKDNILPLFGKPKEKEMKAEMLGVEMNLHVAGMEPGVISEEYRDWVHNMDWRQKMYYWMANPKWYPRHIDINVKPGATDPTTGRTLTIKHKMTPPEATERPKSLFKEFEKDLENSFVHVWHVHDEFKGAKERRAEMEVRYSYTPNRQDHWFQMFYERTPVFTGEKENVKMCMVAKMKQTTTDWVKLNKEDIKHINDDQRIDVQADIHYGKSCKDKPEVQINLSYEHSPQQKMWLKELGSHEEITDTVIMPGFENPYTKLYKKCVEWLGKGMNMPMACHKFIVHTSQLNSMKLDIAYDDQLRFLNSPHVSTLWTMMKSKYYPYLKLNALRNTTTPGRVHIESVIRENSPIVRNEKRLATVLVNGPTRTSMWSDVPVSFGAHWAPRTATHLGQTNLQTYSRKWYHRYCDIQMNSVATFDDVIYELPETTCWKVLAKDCSENNLFTLLTKETAEKKKDVKLLLDNYHIEVKHTGEKTMLTMNGAEEELTTGVPKVLTNEAGITNMILISMDKHTTMIDSPTYGIYIIACDNSVFVQVAPYYRGKMCGLCSNFNLDRQHEMHTTDGCHHHTPWSYASHYVLPDAQCTVPPVTNAGTPVCKKH